MAPITQASDESNHQALMDQLDIWNVRKPFRNPNWKAPSRRNKNVRQIVSEASRKEQSQMATTNNSGLSTPMPETSDFPTREATPVNGHHQQPNIAQASLNLNQYVLEKNAQALNGQLQPGHTHNGLLGSGPGITYTNIESAPSLHPSSQRHYCDITGLPAPYTDPKSRLRYHNGEIFGVVRALGQGSTEGYLAARGAQIVLK